MDQIIKDSIREFKPDSKEITLEGHARKIRIMYEKFAVKRSLMEYLSVPKEVIENIEEKYSKITTISGVICSIFTYLKAVKADEKIIDYFYKKYIGLKREINKINDLNEKTEIEEKNWITQAEVKQRIDYLKTYLDIKHNSFDNFQQYLVLNLYFLITPLRNDYARVEVFNKFEEDYPGNSIALDTKKLTLNEYKTSKTYGRKTIVLPDELVDIVAKWIIIREKIHPELIGRKELLFNLKLTPMNQVNLTMYLNKIFGRRVSSTMLRKSYLSERFPVNESIFDMKELAGNMCHSIRDQQSSYRKK